MTNKKWYYDVTHISNQDIVPFDCVDTVRELFVPEHKVAELSAEAERLPQLEITKVTNYNHSVFLRKRNSKKLANFVYVI